MSDRVSSENKIENYRDFLWKINYSNGLYVMTPSMIINPYKACIGSGNNSFLIKGILKRRYWWTVVEKSEIASNDVHFLWTQLKINPYFKKQNKGSKMSYETMPQEYKISTKGFENDCKIFGKNDLFNWKNHMSKNEKAEEKITENTYKKRVALYKRK